MLNELWKCWCCRCDAGDRPDQGGHEWSAAWGVEPRIELIAVRVREFDLAKHFIMFR